MADPIRSSVARATQKPAPARSCSTSRGASGSGRDRRFRHLQSDACIGRAIQRRCPRSRCSSPSGERATRSPRFRATAWIAARFKPAPSRAKKCSISRFADRTSHAGRCGLTDFAGSLRRSVLMRRCPMMGVRAAQQVRKVREVFVDRPDRAALAGPPDRVVPAGPRVLRARVALTERLGRQDPHRHRSRSRSRAPGSSAQTPTRTATTPAWRPLGGLGPPATWDTVTSARRSGEPDEPVRAERRHARQRPVGPSCYAR